MENSTAEETTKATLKTVAGKQSESNSGRAAQTLAEITMTKPQQE